MPWRATLLPRRRGRTTRRRDRAKAGRQRRHRPRRAPASRADLAGQGSEPAARDHAEDAQGHSSGTGPAFAERRRGRAGGARARSPWVSRRRRTRRCGTAEASGRTTPRPSSMRARTLDGPGRSPELHAEPTAPHRRVARRPEERGVESTSSSQDVAGASTGRPRVVGQARAHEREISKPSSVRTALRHPPPDARPRTPPLRRNPVEQHASASPPATTAPGPARQGRRHGRLRADGQRSLTR